jgi:hypothetical protein
MKKYLVFGVLVAMLAAGSTVWLLGQQGPAKVAWSQPELLEFLLPMEQRKVTLSFRVDKNMSDAVLVLTPSLANLVTVSPLSFKKIDAKKDNKLTLTLKAPSTSEVKFAGTLHLRSAAPGTSTATIAEPLPVTIVVHSQRVPPDPGEAGKQTLEGIDADGDGVRDDVERWILSTFLNSPREQAVLHQYAVGFGSLLLNADTPDPYWHEVILASRCAIGIVDVKDIGQIRRHIDIVKSQYQNTEARSRAYLKAARSRYVLNDDPADLTQFCDFTLGSLGQ